MHVWNALAMLGAAKHRSDTASKETFVHFSLRGGHVRPQALGSSQYAAAMAHFASSRN